MVDIKNYLSYDGLKLYDELIKKYIATADGAVLNQILGEIKEGDAETIAALNELVRTVTGTAGTALQEITKGTDGDFVLTTVTQKGADNKQSVAVSVKTAALTGEEDGLVTASDARTALSGKSNVDHTHTKSDITDFEHTHAISGVEGLQDALDGKSDDNHTHTKSDITDFEHTHTKSDITDFEHTHAISEVEGLQDALNGKVDKVEGKGLSTNDFTGELKTKLDGIAAGAEVNYIKSVGDNLAVDGDGKLTVTIPEATVTGVDATAVSGLKLTLTNKVVGLADAGLAELVAAKTVTVEKAADTTDDQCVYEIKQGGVVVGTINHPKDKVVEKGELVTVDEVQYLRLTIANQTEPVDIAVKDLVDVYTAGAGIDVTGSVVSVKLAEAQGNVVLDTTDGLKAHLEGWEPVKDASHTHNNENVLNGITAEKVAAWDAKQDAMVAISNEEINALFPEVTSL